MADKHDETGETLGRRDFLKAAGAAATTVALGAGCAPIERQTLEEFIAENPEERDWVGTPDRNGYHQFGGLGTDFERVELPRGGDFSPADFTGTSPTDIGARDVDLRNSRFDAGSDFGVADLNGTQLGGAFMVDADLRYVSLSRDTSFYDASQYDPRLSRDEQLGGAVLAGAQLDGQYLEGDMRYVDATGASMQGVSFSYNTQTLGLNLERADVTGMNLQDLDDQQLAGIRNLDLAIGADPYVVDRWFELGGLYSKADDNAKPTPDGMVDPAGIERGNRAPTPQRHV